MIFVEVISRDYFKIMRNNLMYYLVVWMSIIGAIVKCFMYYSSRSLHVIKDLEQEILHDVKWILSSSVMMSICSLIALYYNMLFVDFFKLFILSNLFSSIFRLILRFCWKLYANC
ncbi:MAG: divalent metal cation (Fe/Co/Zn/Cd) transporter [Alteromonas naphthalenivorans]|jgi:divalent metal cation (Fe/Co/Zn/Cd) transporter